MGSGARSSREARSSVRDPLRPETLGRPGPRRALAVAVVFGTVCGVGMVLSVLGAPTWLLTVAGVAVAEPAGRLGRWSARRHL